MLLDLAFQTRRKLSGLRATWKYLAQGQIVSGAWFGFMEKPEITRHRLDLVAKHYPMRCDEFAIESTYSLFSEPVPARIAPKDVMVYFLGRQDRTEEAVQFTEVMVNCILEDTRTLPLSTPRWAAELLAPTVSGCKCDDLRILIARLGWPSTSTRWWAMQEFAVRLAEPENKAATEGALLQLLRECQLEAEVVELLCIFWMAAQGYAYAPALELASAFPKPSWLASQLMAEMRFAVGDKAEDLVQLPTEFELPHHFWKMALKNELPSSFNKKQL